MGGIGEFIRKNASTILTWGAAIGAVATPVLTVNATLKALHYCAEETDRKGEQLTLREAAKISAPHFILPALSTALTVTCTFGANATNVAKQASLAGTCAVLDRAYREYRNAITSKYGSETDTEVHGNIVRAKIKKDPDREEDGKSLFFDEYGERFFRRTKEEVITAEYHFNRNFILRGYATLNEYYEFLGLPKIEIGEKLGWSIEAGEIFYGYSWVDFSHPVTTTDDGLECHMIEYPFPPTADFMDPEDE